MCGIVGFANITDNISHFQDTLINMTNSLSSKGPYEDGFYTNTHICMSHKRLLEINPNDIEQPILFKDGERKIVLTYNGRIYNSLEIKKDLTNLGYSFSSNSDTEILFKAYLEYGYDILNKLNGVFSFAIWDDFKQELFLARDHFGIKPLFYTLNNNNFIFSSEIKALFEFPMVEPILDKTSISELIGIGPAHTPGMTVFKNIYELKPAHFAIFNSSGLHIERYWKLETFEHHDDLEKTSDTLKNLLEESINEQLVSDIPLCTFLSGGLDSSIITLYAKNYYEKHNLGDLNTFSVDYIDNDKNFVKTDFQPNSDSYYINIMKDKLNTSHHTIMLDTPELAKFLEDAMIARDMPGMADVDSSLLLFCKNVKKEATVSLTGECADEIFGGYPWFFREDALSSNTFPWSIAISERQHLLNLDINNKINLKEYIDFRYHESLSEVETLSSDSFETAQKERFHILLLIGLCKHY